MGIIIDIKNNESTPFYCLSGDIHLLTENRRIVLSLRRLKYLQESDNICIPFIEEEKIRTLQEIVKLLDKFEISHNLSDNSKDEVQSYQREEELFHEFSQKAKSIRNNEFEVYPELVEDFDSFQQTLKEKMVRTLYELQLLSAYHMAFAQNSCNFAVPGAGKTSIVYGAYAYLKNLPESHPKRVEKLLVIGPISSFAPWENEFEACFGYKTSFQRLSGDITQTKDDKLEHLYGPNPAEVTLIFHGGVDSLQNEIIDFLKTHRTMVVVDEAHRIKNPDGVWGRSVTEISKEAISRVALTGTPLPNGYEDLYNLYKFIYSFKYKDILKAHYTNLIDMTQQDSIDSVRVEELKENISPFFIRIKKEDLNLPPVEEHVIHVDMFPRQREIYDFIESKYIQFFKEDNSATVKDILNRARLIRLRQASTNPALLLKALKDSIDDDSMVESLNTNMVYDTYKDEYIDDSEFFKKINEYSDAEIPAKYVEIFKIIRDKVLPVNGKVIIWTIFIQNSKDLQTYLKHNGIKSKLLIGEVLQEEREVIIEKFNNPNNKDFQVVIANPFSVAESISLHKGCHNAIYLERDYNASNYIQSKDRIHRVGLDENQITNYYYVISKDSIDEVINVRLRDKVKRMEKIINDDIPLFSRIEDGDESDIIKDLIKNYAKRS